MKAAVRYRPPGRGKVLRLARMTPEKVAEIGYQALVAKKQYIVAGLPNKAAVFATRFLPRRLLCRVVKLAMS